MSLWGSFTGADANKAIKKGQQQALGNIDQGTTQAQGQFDQATGYLNPYSQGGQQGYRAYIDSLGLNGRDAQAAIQAGYFSDPIQNQLMDGIARSNTRAFTGRGMNNSGAATQALTNALLAQYGGYQDRLAGLGSQGLQAAGAQAGIRQHAGDTYFAAGQQRAGINTSAANAQAANANTFFNNILGVGSLAVSAYTGMPMKKPGGANALTAQAGPGSLSTIY